jgi:hypothetical protein
VDEKDRLDFLLRYHANLTMQMTAVITNGSGATTLNEQLSRVEKAIESILFKDEP